MTGITRRFQRKFRHGAKGKPFRPAPAAILAATALLSVAGLWACDLFSAGDGFPPRQRYSRSNVILIMIDTLRADHLSCYGYGRDTSPQICSLAEDSVLFENAFSNAPSTKPSITSLFTSLYPHQHKAVYNEDVLSDDLVTIAEVLARNGYSTYGISRKPNFSRKENAHQGFSRWKGISGGRSNPRYHNFINETLFAELERYQQPFFLWLHYNDPHVSYVAPEPFYRYFNKDYSGPVTGKRPFDVPWFRERPEELRQLETFYDNEIAWVDHKIGNLVSELKNRGLYDDSIIILLSDHGEMFLEHGHFLHSNGMYSEVIHVPLIMKLPGSEGGLRVSSHVQLIDIFPTILDMLSLSSEQKLMGDSLLTVTDKADRPIYGEHIRLDWTNPQRSLIYGKKKLIESLDSGDFALFDLEEDPMEQRNIFSDHPSAGTLISLMEDTLRQSEKASGVVARETRELDSATKEKLRSLGYMK